ncbi:MoaD/ThiS family protein [Mycobacterium sp. MYCO198283]|uniref:MoaD/ThiS family protein n=1 Tax=Mycobacterium sp. MYCO198283 TaxID=2883505 RepID=UPI001E576255|nr:MoaD/ThiS family protein [Mycobacterium sp. MYCO198283]MCG5431152.1 MoaD/ThiS family protein [Mycobacterium sp. MYCO198283]
MADSVTIVVRFFAAARAAAGTDEERLDAPAGTTVADIARRLSERDPALARVLRRCSYLCDGTAVRDPSTTLADGRTLDVLPPFAGG